MRDAQGIATATLCLVAPRDDGLKNHAFYLQCLKQAAQALSGKH
jgi:hypothetical protein